MKNWHAGKDDYLQVDNKPKIEIRERERANPANPTYLCYNQLSHPSLSQIEHGCQDMSIWP